VRYSLGRLVTVVLDVRFCCFCRVMRYVVQVPLRGVRVMRRRQVIAGLVMFGGFAMMPSRVFVVLSCLVMVFCRLF
jgi:hypothetical protein